MGDEVERAKLRALNVRARALNIEHGTPPASVTGEEIATFLTNWRDEYGYAAEAWTRRAHDAAGAFRPDVALHVANENARKRDIVQAILDKVG